MIFTIHPPFEVKQQIDDLAEQMRKLLGLTKGSVLIKFADRKVKDWNVQVESR